MTKPFIILSTLLLLVPHALSYKLARPQRSPTVITESHNETSTTPSPTESTNLKKTPAIPETIVVVANMTKADNSSTSKEPMKILAKVKAAKPYEGKAPAISLVPPSASGAPVGLVALVPPHKPVQINADVPPKTPVKVQTEIAPEVPIVAVVVGHGMARFYSPWKKPSSTTRYMFNVNVR